MNGIDERIREALDAEDAVLYDELGEPSLLGRALEVMSGRMKWINLLVWFIGTLFFIAGILSLLLFFDAQETKEMLVWGGGFMFCMMAVMMMKLWFWIEMQKNSVLREVKRVELQIARMSEKLDG